MSSSFFRGTSTEQTSYFADKERKMVADYVWPKTFDSQIDLSNVSLDMVKSWLCQKVADLTGTEDEILIEFILNSLLDTTQVDPRTLTVRLTGFLGDHAFDFVASLWKLLLDAQKNQIPDELRDAQNKEVEAQKLEAERIKKELAELTRGSSPYDSGGLRTSRRAFSPGRRKYSRHNRRYERDDISQSSRDRRDSPHRNDGRRLRQQGESRSPSRSPTRKRRHYSPSPKRGYSNRYDNNTASAYQRRSPRRQYSRTGGDSPVRNRYTSRTYERVRRDNSRSPSSQRVRQRDKSPPYEVTQNGNYENAQNVSTNRYDSPRIMQSKRSPSPRPRWRRSRSPGPNRHYGRDDRSRAYNRSSPAPGRRRQRYSDDYGTADWPRRNPYETRGRSTEEPPRENLPASVASSNEPTVISLKHNSNSKTAPEILDEINIASNTGASDTVQPNPAETYIDRPPTERHCYMDEVPEGGGAKPLWLSSQAISPVKRSSSEERLRALALQTLRRR